ncbi:DExH-box splicing factor binding site-domain-containing protein [Trametes elegans]|nr:DExH-box splicing factor binding site-domain-containing protein [Trametes elegans]
MSSAAQQAKVSFTIRRPTPASDSDSSFRIPTLPRHLSGDSTPNSPLARSSPPSPKHKPRTYTERDSSDEDSGPEDELVTGFDQFGAQRLHEKPKAQGPLVIPALKNKDWRELARKRKQLYVPPTAAPATGADGSVGGLGTRDVINSGPQSVGLQVKKRPKVKKEEAATETDDQRALRAILASAAGGGDAGLDGPPIDVIPAPSEDDAYKQDVEELPESATLADYERVPVSQFGAALLRGMGWKEGTAASKKGKGPVEPYLPPARPALLGIGAKEKEVFDDGSKRKGGKGRPERRYVPVIKKERDSGSGRESSSRPRSPVSSTRNGSRKPSRSPSPDRRKDRDGRRDDRDRYRDSGRDRSDRRRDGDYDSSRRDRERDRRRDDDYGSSRRDKDRDYDSSRRDRDRRGDRSAEKYDSSRRKDRY